MDFRIIAQQLRKPEGDIGRRAGKRMNEGNSLMYRFTLDALKLGPNDHVLEIGMGNGAFVRDLIEKESSVRYVGCDFSPTMVEEARRNNKELSAISHVEFRESEMGDLPFSSDSFDWIFTVNTIYFWDNVEKELGEVKRVLKQNGKLLIALRPKSIMKDMPFVQHGFHLYEKEDVANVLTQHGFRIVQVREEKEPDQDMEGIMIRLATLIITAERI